MDKYVRPRALLLFGGPKWDLDAHFHQRLSLLSRDFSGDVLAAGSHNESRQYGLFEVHCMRHQRHPYLRMMVRVVVHAIARRLHGQSFDLVVTSDPIRTGLLGLLAARILGARLVVELNGNFTDDVLYTDAKTGKVAVRKKSLYLCLLRFVVSRSSGVRALYPEQITPYRDFLGHAVLASFADHVDLSPFEPHEDEQKVVLLAGFPSRVKGTDLLIEAFKRVAPSHPDWRLVVIGWYPQPELVFGNAATHPRIEIREPVPHRQMPDHVAQSAICVLASRSEGVPRFLLEAMRAGKARIGSRIGGIPSIIEHGVDGLLFEPENVDELAHHLDSLMGDDALRARLGAAALARSSAYDGESYYRQMRDFLMRVLGREPVAINELTESPTSNA